MNREILREEVHRTLLNGGISGDDARAKYAGEYVEKVAGAVNAAKDGMVDDIIDPAKTRAMLISALEMLGSKRDSNPPKKHDNLPM